LADWHFRHVSGLAGLVTLETFWRRSRHTPESRKTLGMLRGLVAGACNQRYLQLWSGAA
jgi:hypothetical protein